MTEKATRTGWRRKIAPDEHTVSLLAAHRELWQRRREQVGAPLSVDVFVFSNSPDGLLPYTPRAISQRYRKLALKLELRSTRLHSLRHYSATELVAAGVDIRTVAGRLGYGSGGATRLKVYAAWVDEAHRACRTPPWWTPLQGAAYRTDLDRQRTRSSAGASSLLNAAQPKPW